MAGFLKSSYLWLHNYSLDMLLLLNMNLELHVNLQIIYTDFMQQKYGVWLLVTVREKHSGCKAEMFVDVMTDIGQTSSVWEIHY